MKNRKTRFQILTKAFSKTKKDVKIFCFIANKNEKLFPRQKKM